MTINERDTSGEAKSTEFYDARERDSKAKWHYDRAGKQKHASLKKGVENDYQSQLLKRGVKDSDGNQKPLERKEDPYRQKPFRQSRAMDVRFESCEEVAIRLLEHPAPRGHSLRVSLKSGKGLTYTHYASVPERNTSTENEHRRDVEEFMNHPDCEHSKHGPWKVTHSYYES